MSDKFPAFAKIVAASFQELTGGQNVFIVDVDGDALYGRYLAAFPEGENPLFKNKTKHECTSCRHFVRRAGSVVAPGEDDTLRTVWDLAAEEAPEPYHAVATELRDIVRGANIVEIFKIASTETSFGAPITRSLDKDSGQAVSWQHLHTGEIPKTLRTASPDEARGKHRTAAQVFERGLVELRSDAVETVLSLIEDNSLYRGEEHKPAILAFQKMQRAYASKLDAQRRRLLVWTHAMNPGAQLRNTVIGTLVQDLSEGQDVERAVRSFETKVAPQNYKRTSAVVTPGMVKKALETIDALGLESALERRFAVIGDVSVRDVKWVDGATKPLMKGGIGEMLMKHATQTKKGDADEEHAEDIALDEFVSKVLPETTGLELFFRGELAGNLMSLTAPCDPEPKRLFRWDNDFAWSYGGNVADSIRERVKKAGGKVEGATLRISLSWFNYSDLDLHVYEPPGRGIHGGYDHIYFRNKTGWTGGTLDVDMNAGFGKTREAVENIVWTRRVPDGIYRVVVNNYAHRETADPGFVVEIEYGGRLTHFSYNKDVRDGKDVAVAVLHMKGGVLERIDTTDPTITSGNISQEKWNLKTEQYVKVNAVTLSPNYWGDNSVGNRHTFFVVDSARNDEPTRGFYTEFLHPRLEPHRKVFEVIADKTKCRPTDGQLSGLGFSSTKKESFVVRAQQGKKRRLYNVHVGS